MLIACTEDCVIGWHLARGENSQAWAALMARIAAPDVVVTNGGSGFGKTRRVVWSNTSVQCCVFHAFEQVLHDHQTEAASSHWVHDILSSASVDSRLNRGRCLAFWNTEDAPA